MTQQNGRKWMFQTHKELKQQVVVWILILKADGALFLQMDGVDERDGALVPVGHQVVSLRQPRGAAVPRENSADIRIQIYAFFSRIPLADLLQLSLSSPREPLSSEVARLLNPAGMESHWSKRTPLPRE